MRNLIHNNKRRLFSRGGLIPPIAPVITPNEINYQIAESNDQISRIKESGIDPSLPEEEIFRRGLAKGSSVVGSILLWVPHPIAKVGGIILGVPDLYYDIKDYYNNPNTGNGTSLLLDVPAKIPNIPGYIDDALRFTGIADDLTGLPSEGALWLADNLYNYFRKPVNIKKLERLKPKIKGSEDNPYTLPEITITGKHKNKKHK